MFLSFSIGGWFNQVDHARRCEHEIGDDGILPANLVDFVPSIHTSESNDSLSWTKLSFVGFAAMFGVSYSGLADGINQPQDHEAGRGLISGDLAISLLPHRLAPSPLGIQASRAS